MEYFKCYKEVFATISVSINRGFAVIRFKKNVCIKTKYTLQTNQIVIYSIK